MQSVVCVRAVRHFVHLWQRTATQRKLLRQQAAYHVLLLLLAKHLPPSIGYEIYACLRLQKQVQAQQSTLTASGIQRQSMLQPLAACHSQALSDEQFHVLYTINIVNNNRCIVYNKSACSTVSITCIKEDMHNNTLSPRNTHQDLIAPCTVLCLCYKWYAAN